MVGEHGRLPTEQDEARRIAVHAQLLDTPRLTDIVDVVDRLTILQIDDQLVGKLGATADRKAGTLVVNAIHQDVRFTKATTAAVRAEIRNLATWLGLEVTGS
jgi:uncharacterized protein YcaQ